MIKCKENHTKYQPITWECPECGAGEGDFVIEDGSAIDCDLIHTTDHIKCYKCDYQTSGSVYSRRMKNQETSKVCPCCNGKGVVNV